MLICLALLFSPIRAARAQLAKSFYNITSITAKELPNAVQITIKTDGAVTFGGSEDELFDVNRVEQRYATRKLSEFRIRLAGAKSKVPAFVNLGAYPVDSAVITLGNTPLTNIINRRLQKTAADVPLIDITLRFFVPVTLKQFLFSPEGYGYSFGSLDVGDVQVKMGADNSSIIITVLSDRAEITRNANRLKRSPSDSHKHRLDVHPNGGPRLHVDALHTPLSVVVRAVSESVNLPIVVQEDAADLDVSLFLPDVSPPELLAVLANGYALAVIPRGDEVGGGFVIGRDGLTTQTEIVPLRNLNPIKARLLFPDFLLRRLRADTEQNALVVSGSHELIDRVRRDAAVLDVARPQIRVDVQAFEINRSDALFYNWQGVFQSGGIQFDTLAGTIAVKLSTGQRESLALTLNALQTKGKVRLQDKGFVTVASGATGTLFLGQTRYVVVLQQSGGFGTQTAKAIKLPIGTTLTVTPVASNDGEVNIDIAPKFSTLDELEAGTGLPTIGTRTLTASVRVRPDETILVAALENETDDRTKRALYPFERLPIVGGLLGGLLGSRRANREHTGFILLITARTVGADSEKKVTKL